MVPYRNAVGNKTNGAKLKIIEFYYSFFIIYFIFKTFVQF